MRQRLDYNVHGLLKFRIVRDERSRLQDVVGLRFPCFRVNEIEQPEITLNIGKFIPANEGCYIIDRKYHVKENYLYCHDSAGGATWKVEIFGLEQGDTTINFEVSNGPRPYRWLNKDFLPQMLLLRVLEYKLSRKGYLLMHSAAVCRDDTAYLLCGRGSSFKTTLCMDLVRQHGFSLLGDDRVIIAKDKVLSFLADTSSPLMFQFMTDHLTTERSWTIFKKLGYVAQALKTRSNSSRYVASQANPTSFFFVERQTGMKEATIEPYQARGQTSARIVTNNRLEDFTRLADFGINSAPFLKYFLAYSFVFPASAIAASDALVRRNLDPVLANLSMYQLKMPFRYNDSVAGQFARFVAGGNRA